LAGRGAGIDGESHKSVASGLRSRYVFLQTAVQDEAEEVFRRLGFETRYNRNGFTMWRRTEGRMTRRGRVLGIRALASPRVD